MSRELTFLMRRVYGGADVVFANSISTRQMLVELGIPAAVPAGRRRRRDPAPGRAAR
jgi:hypothetical protein